MGPGKLEEGLSADLAPLGQRDTRVGLVRVLVVEDHPLMAEAIIYALRGQKWIEVVGTSATAEEAVSLAGSLHPDVVILDLRLGRRTQSTNHTAKCVAEAAPSARIIVYSAYVTHALVWQLAGIGVLGYVSKAEPTEILVESVAAVSAGHVFYSSEVRAVSQASQTEFDEGARAITAREAEVVQLIAEGHTNPEIASCLSVSVSAVIKFIASAFRKLGATNRLELVLRAARAGLIIIDE